MIKRLRMRFITLALTSVLSVIVIVAVSINMTVFSNISSVADGDIDRLYGFITENSDYYEWYGSWPPNRDLSAGDGKSPYSDPLPSGDEVTFFVIRQLPDRTVSAEDIGRIPGITENDARELVRSALNSYKDRGGVKTYRYGIFEDGSGTKTVVFVNIENSLAFFHSLLRMSVLVAAACLLVAAGAVYLISNSVVKDAARSMDRQKQFITNASHDLKTPIAVIGANMDVLSLEDGDNPWVDSTKKQVSRLKKLVTDLIDVSKLSEDTVALRFENFDLSALVSEIAEPFRDMAELRGFCYSQNIEPGIIISGSDVYLRKLLAILCDNAIKYTNDGGRIELDLSRFKNSIYLSLFNTSDQVRGLDVERLFDRFYTGESSRSKETSGSGIGLAVAQAIVDAHGGEIYAHCDSDDSIVFTVILK
ncbi:MAG: HAMP domain-containing histidine kinase [Oscillospiraceae bacterium]|nr:HAMP domain-containing histidine kinase [Oscillospiraceae bacterium]